ncbi:hypothetical protein QBC38DRAFT_117539 [Podospora fimiseda]|uniref:Uncharacterized protein n=1 Tax=Podospora fimiseda TaxID=252190 RepID=A0AAN7BFL8_9PEZI|nr:hypothetical protein QBC38DRAFT_117539 [Podospora fimiseda]
MGSSPEEQEEEGYFKNWDDADLIRCGALHTNIYSYPTLNNPIHPLFTNFTVPPGDDYTLISELFPSLRLATLLLQSSGLPWLSEFFISDIFSPLYPGFDHLLKTPTVITRHHSASWATPQQKYEWINSTHHILLSSAFFLPDEIQWRLDPDILSRHGWVGYTARHQHFSSSGLNISLNDHPDCVLQSDKSTISLLKKTSRCMTILIMREYALHLRYLSTGSEEWLFTAFMCACTLLHEIGHLVYWKDFRAINKKMTEPYFGDDLEMELGDSFVSSIFGGWCPVPIENRFGFTNEGGRFRGGLGWRQFLRWGAGGKRPRWRVGYSVRVDYIAALFDIQNWRNYETCPELLIRPWTLPESCSKSTTIIPGVTEAGLHASAALPDYEDDKDGNCVWKRRPAADFRIPLYRDLVVVSPEAANDYRLRAMCPPEPEARDPTIKLSRIQIIKQEMEMGGGDMIFWIDGKRVDEESDGVRSNAQFSI